MGEWAFFKEGKVNAVKVVEATIVQATDDDLTPAIDLEGYSISGLIIPVLTSANLTFTVSETIAGTYFTVKDKDAAAFTIAAGTGSLAVSSVDLEALKGYRFIKIASSAGQVSNRVFKFILKNGVY